MGFRRQTTELPKGYDVPNDADDQKPPVAVRGQQQAPTQSDSYQKVRQDGQ